MSLLPSEADRCVVIAEAGVNHNGEVEAAKDLIDVAVDAGCDVIKFQTFDPDEVVTEETEKAAYQHRSSSENQHEMLNRFILTEDEHEVLMDYCKDGGIEFLSTPYDPQSVSLLESVGVERYKIASADIVNKPLLEAVTETGKPIIQSTGMATLGEIERTVNWFRARNSDDVTLLHCVSCYPTRPEQVNMRFMETLHTAFDLPVGFSDHTKGIEISLMAASLGASVVEKHLTLDRRMEGPDHLVSLEPDEMERLVTGIRDIETAAGQPRRQLTSPERENIKPMRRSLHLRHDINAGETLTKSDLKVVRPATGIDPWQIDEITGRRLSSNLAKNDPLVWDDLE